MSFKSTSNLQLFRLLYSESGYKRYSFQQSIKEIVDTAVSNSIAPLNDKLTKVDSLIQQISVLEEKLANLELKLTTAEKDVKWAAAKANDNQQYSRKRN